VSLWCDFSGSFVMEVSLRASELPMKFREGEVGP
jgi:hypothetical protein